MKIRLERIKEMRVVCTYSLSENPEEDAWKKIEAWAKPKGLLNEGAESRLFGRNVYPTENPEPHGYEFYLTVNEDIEPDGEIEMSEIPGGLYAVLRFENLDKIGEAWKKMWEWIEKSDYEHIGWKKGENGWVNGYEEHLNTLSKSTKEWIFDLWVQLKE